ncbi:MAG TPA: histidine kinase, partial [Anaerolineae bacterium]
MSFVDRSLRLKISLGVSLALLLLLLPFNWLQYRFERSEAIADLSRLAGTTGAVAEDSLEWAMLNDNRQAIQTLIDSVAEVQDVRAVYLLDPQARVAASPQARFNGQQLDQKSAVCQECHRFPAANRPRSTFVTAPDGQPLFRTMTPIINGPACEACHSPQNRLNGVLYVDFSMAGLNDRLDRQLKATLTASLAIVVIAALAIYLLLSRLVIVPMEQVGRALRRFTGGERATRIYVNSADEIGMLAAGFNTMAGTIEAQAARAEQLYEELETKDALRSQLLHRLTAAREDERRNIARELHDELGQLLTGMSLHLRLARQSLSGNTDGAREHLDRAAGLIGETIEESHRMIADL